MTVAALATAAAPPAAEARACALPGARVVASAGFDTVTDTTVATVTVAGAGTTVTDTTTVTGIGTTTVTITVAAPARAGLTSRAS